MGAINLWWKNVYFLFETVMAKCDLIGGFDPRDVAIFSWLNFPLQRGYLVLGG